MEEQFAMAAYAWMVEWVGVMGLVGAAIAWYHRTLGPTPLAEHRFHFYPWPIPAWGRLRVRLSVGTDDGSNDCSVTFEGGFEILGRDLGDINLWGRQGHGRIMDTAFLES